MSKWISIVFLALFSCLCAAQPKPTAKNDNQISVKRSSAKEPLRKFSMALIEGDRVDLKFTGFHILDVINAIEKLSVKNRGEFESTVDFYARRSASLAKKFLTNASVEDVYGFVVPVTNGKLYVDGLKYAFNPDTSELRLFALPKSASISGIRASDASASPLWYNNFDQFDLESKIGSTRTYQASNAFGAKIAVEETILKVLGIAAGDIKFLTHTRDISYRDPIPTVWFNMEVAKAAKELPKLKALIVVRLVDPYVLYDFKHSMPTRDYPFETKVYGRYLAGDVLGILFYSGLTGEVFARLPDGFGKNTPKAEVKSEDQ